MVVFIHTVPSFLLILCVLSGILAFSTTLSPAYRGYLRGIVRRRQDFRGPNHNIRHLQRPISINRKGQYGYEHHTFSRGYYKPKAPRRIVIYRETPVLSDHDNDPRNNQPEPRTNEPTVTARNVPESTTPEPTFGLPTFIPTEVELTSTTFNYYDHDGITLSTDIPIIVTEQTNTVDSEDTSANSGNVNASDDNNTLTTEASPAVNTTELHVLTEYPPSANNGSVNNTEVSLTTEASPANNVTVERVSNPDLASITTEASPANNVTVERVSNPDLASITTEASPANNVTVERVSNPDLASITTEASPANNSSEGGNQVLDITTPASNSSGAFNNEPPNDDPLRTRPSESLRDLINILRLLIQENNV